MASASAGTGEPGRSMPVRRSAAFSLTCSRLSQYLKEKGNLGVEMSWAFDAANKGTTPEPPRTMNLFPADREDPVLVATPQKPAPPPPLTEKQLLPPPAVAPPQQQPRPQQQTLPLGGAQMTIFYGGKVIVFDNYPADKAKELLSLTGRGTAQANKTQQQHQGSSGVPAVPTPVKPAAACIPAPAAAVPVASPAVVVTSAPAVSMPQKPPQPPVASDLPIARRVSLNRFLEKRKDRIQSKAPYPMNPASSSSDGKPPIPEKEKQLAQGMPMPPPPNQQHQVQKPSWLGLAPSDSSS